MSWEEMKSSFFDELEKISATSLSGLSPETVLTSPKPEPMETPGLDKARQILSKMEMFKTAAKRKAKPIVQGYNLPTVAGQPENKNIWDKTKGVAGHGFAGAAVGRMLSDFKPAGSTPKGKFLGMAAGGTAGLADYAYQKARQAKLQKQHTKVATLTSPGLALKASQQVGKVTRTRGLGATIKKSIPRIGTKGSLPTL